jgi:IS30 family transposase
VGYSPDVIAHKINEWREKKIISTKSIYNHIRDREEVLWVYLRYKWWWYRKRWRIKELVRMRHIPLIDERWEEIEWRKRIGDWEVDCIVSKDHKPGLITIVDRRSRYIVIQKKHTFKAEPVSKLITYALYWKRVHSITSDNGVEFQYLDRVWKKLWCKYYRCHPYSSWERWSNERNNREVRVYIPKWSDISDYTEKELLDIQNRINRKPRKILWYKTAEEVFFSESKL